MSCFEKEQAAHAAAKAEAELTALVAANLPFMQVADNDEPLCFDLTWRETRIRLRLWLRAGFTEGTWDIAVPGVPAFIEKRLTAGSLAAHLVDHAMAHVYALTGDSTPPRAYPGELRRELH